ncbi:hypothetical protein V8F20_008109 [Naviculisporaceae sp. PSN 640]
MIRIVTCLVALLVAVAAGLKAPIPGYRVEEFVWGVDVGDGTMVNITGPVENVYHTLMKLNPGLANSVQASPNEPRATDDRAGTHCGPSIFGWDGANTFRIQEGIKYLRTQPGQPVSQPGPGACGRVSCSWDSAIWWCNDKTEEAVLDGFYTIADCAQLVLDRCRYQGAVWDHVVGQHFNVGNWNCIVRRDDDNC